MEPQINTRKFNIVLTVSIYLAFIGAVISIWIFLIIGLLLFMARNAAFIMEKVVQKRFSYDNNSGNNFNYDLGDNTEDKKE
ncbi:MAG: hypothetical protein C5S43_05235 [Candidatus Methanocomedens sp.]|nr:MAG: hypothetical protein C5S43_05235 [ANME-2 cluster archaeon]